MDDELASGPEPAEQPVESSAPAGGTRGGAEAQGGGEERDEAEPVRDWSPGEHDLIPLLPRGTALFEGIPANALVIDALCPAIGQGTVVVRAADCVGVVLVKDGSVFEEYAFESGTGLQGEPARQAIATWADASVAAYRLDPLVVAVIPSLFRGSPCYSDLRLEWTDWRGLLADLCSRDGSFVVELDTPAGRGVTLIVDGRQVATYTESHTDLGPETLLDPLAQTRRGTVWVRREPSRELEPSAPANTEAGAALPGGGFADTAAAEPARYPETAGWSPQGGWPVQPDEELSPALSHELPPPPTGPPANAEESPFARFAAPRTEEAPWGMAAADAAHGGPLPAYADPSVAEVAPDLKQVARNHLQRSSPRIETMIDEAVARDLPLRSFLAEVRGLVIRGVMQSTLDDMADEMAALASPLPPG